MEVLRSEAMSVVRWRLQGREVPRDARVLDSPESRDLRADG